MTTRNIFCALEQTVTPHELTVEPVNGEILATCVCGRFLKFPPTVTPEEFEALVDAHYESNVGQISLEATETLVDSLGDSTGPLENKANSEPTPPIDPPAPTTPPEPILGA